jgi:hypothetical protein
MTQSWPVLSIIIHLPAEIRGKTRSKWIALARYSNNGTPEYKILDG